MNSKLARRIRECRSPRRAAMLCGLCLLALASLTGCEGVAFMADAFSNNKVSAKYELADKPTLVLVDDKDNRLKGQAGEVTQWIRHGLTEQKLVTKTIPNATLQEVRGELGSDYFKTPVTTIGRMAGAGQVIYVKIRSADVLVDPALVRPTAQALVKVIDVEKNERMFPPPAYSSGTIDMPVTEGGYLHTISLNYRTNFAGSADEETFLYTQLAQRLGREIGELFYEHEPHEGRELRRE